MYEIIVKPSGRPSLIDRIVLANTFDEIRKAGFVHLWAMIGPTYDLALSSPEDTPGLRLICSPCGVVDRTSIVIELHPPGSAFHQLSCHWITNFSPIEHSHKQPPFYSSNRS